MNMRRVSVCVCLAAVLLSGLVSCVHPGGYAAYSSGTSASREAEREGRSEQVVFHSGQGTTRKIGDSYFHSDGSSTRKIGDSYFHSDGSSTRKIGDAYFHSDGSSTRKIGDSYFNSDGSSTRRVGNSYFHSDGSSTRRVGNSYFHSGGSSSVGRSAPYHQLDQHGGRSPYRQLNW